MQEAALRVAVVVRVVDNFGDAGVAWRLARGLASSHGARVTLWIDAPDVLGRFVPGLVVDGECAGIRVRLLPLRSAMLAPPLAPWPHLIVEAFGCGLPSRWLDAIEAAPVQPVWINLEYLSAQPWVDGAHGLPSPHPARRLLRWFYYPGFTPSTGGLLREPGAWPPAPADRAAAWRDVGLAPPPRDALAVSLFCYPSTALPALLDAWACGSRRMQVLVPEGVAHEAIGKIAGRSPTAGACHVAGALTLAIVPFVDQDAFDRRLRACDLAIVRGEDSFVRAQWACVPLVWHIYPQDDDAHRAKLDAFATRYATGLAEPARSDWIAFQQSFNAGDGAATAAAWPALCEALPQLRQHARAWASGLAAMPDLATQLVDFARAKL